MFEYINVRTGARLTSPDIICGEDWEVFDGKNVVPKVNKVEPEIVEEDKPEVEESTSSGGITKAEIMAELDALGVDYNSNAKKDELYNLMMGE